jgi:hypothetical protein
MNPFPVTNLFYFGKTTMGVMGITGEGKNYISVSEMMQ